MGSLIKRDSEEETLLFFTSCFMPVADVWTVAAKCCSTKGRHYNTVKCRAGSWKEPWMLYLKSCTNLEITFPLVFLLYEINVLIFELLLVEDSGFCR